MDVGELFVNLGIKGSEKSVAAVTGVKKAMGETASEGLAAKAAIVGVIYALERMFENSSRRGAGLANFSALLGVSAQDVQKYQWAAQQVNVANADVEASFAALQQAMGKTLLGQGAPAGLAQVAKLTGDISPGDIAKWAKSPQLLIKRLQEYAGRETNAWLRNEVLKSFGLNAGMIEALSRQAFKDDILAKAPTLSDKQIKALDHVAAQIANLKQKVMMAFEGFTAGHGSQLVHDIEVVTDGVIKLTTALITLAEKLHVFEAIGSVFGWLAKEMSNIESGVETTKKQKGDQSGMSWWQKMTADLAIEEKQENQLMDKEGVGGALRSFSTAIKSALGATPDVKAASPNAPAKARGGAPAAAKGAAMPAAAARGPSTGGSAPAGASAGAPSPLRLVVPPMAPGLPSPAAAARPTLPPMAPAAAAASQEINVQQTLQFQHDGKDATKTADSVKTAVQKTYRQMYAQGQVV